MAGLDRERVVAIATPVQGRYEVGSGYVIDTASVLTAAHVLAGADSCLVRRLVPDGSRFDLGPELRGTVVWRGRRDDAALVRIEERRTFAPQQLGHIEGAERVPCEGVGFPLFQLEPGKAPRWNTEELRGQIAPLTRLRSTAMTVHIEGSVPTPGGGAPSPWKGFSGTALFAGPVLVGVVSVHATAFGASRLEAVPVAALADDPEFIRVFERETGREFATKGAAEPALGLPAGVAVTNFLQQYLGEGERVVPFAGRDSELAELNAWLDDPGRPSLLLTGLPGRGKSALLAQWWRRLERDRDRTRTAFVPISIRHDLNRETDVLRAAVPRLAAAQGESLAPSSDPEVLRRQLGALLSSPPPAERTTVLILDGLDEAADWQAWRSLLPLSPADRVKVVASARLTATRSTATQWLEELGWEEGAAATVSVDKLTPAGTRAVIESAGPELAGIAGDAEAVERLHSTTDGDPLVLTLYLRHLRGAAVADPQAAVRDLAPADTGLEGFVERWWRDQGALWGPDGGTREPVVRTTFNVLATALGPLERAGLLGLVGREREIDGDQLREAIEALERMVIAESPASVALSHPRIGEHRLEQLRADGELETYEQLFLEWGRETLDDLLSGRLEPPRTPVYPVLHHRGHLDRLCAERGVSDELVARYLELLAPVWLQAWEETADQSAGYLEDVEAARRAAGEADRTAVAAGGDAPFVAAEVRCAMVRAEQECSFALVQGDLLGTLVAEGIWSGRRAVAACEGIEGPWPRAKSLVAAIPHLDGRDLRRAGELLPALTETHEIYEEAVARLARRLAETEGEDAARAFADGLERGRAAALLGLLPLAPAERRAELVRAVWAELETDPGAELFDRLTATVSLELAREALGTGPADRVTELLSKTGKLSPPGASLPELKGVERAYAMRYRGPWLEPTVAGDETAEILERIRSDGQIFNVDDALGDLAPYLSDEHGRAAHAVVEELIPEDRRPAAWAILLSTGGQADRDARRERALAGLADLDGIRFSSEAAGFLAALARHGAAEACLDRVAALGDEERDRAKYLAALAPHLDAGQVRRALELARTWGFPEAESATQALLARLGAFGAAEAREALAIAALPEGPAGAGGTTTALSQIGRLQLDLAAFLPLAGDAPRQAALAICARSSALDGTDLLQAMLSFRTDPIDTRELLEPGALELFAELHPQLSDEEVTGTAAQGAAQLVIDRGLHPRKAQIVDRWMRRIAAAAGEPAPPDSAEPRPAPGFEPPPSQTGRLSSDNVWAGQMMDLVPALEVDEARRLHESAKTIRQSSDRAKLLAATAARIGVLGQVDEAIEKLAQISPEHLAPPLGDLFESAPDAELDRLIGFAAERLGMPWFGAQRVRVWVTASRRVEALPPERQLLLLQSWLDRRPSREEILSDLLLFAPTILRLGGRPACEKLRGRLEVAGGPPVIRVPEGTPPITPETVRRGLEEEA